MLYPEEIKSKDYADKAENHHLIFDGTVSLNDSDDVPQIKGLIELLSQYFDSKTKQNL